MRWELKRAVGYPEYAPRLRRRKRELERNEDARSGGWLREVERHHCAVERREQLLADLGEALAGPEAVDYNGSMHVALGRSTNQ